jgi:uncharacterized protein YcgL (UPF0745 family)
MLNGMISSECAIYKTTDLASVFLYMQYLDQFNKAFRSINALAFKPSRVLRSSQGYSNFKVVIG